MSGSQDPTRGNRPPGRTSGRPVTGRSRHRATPGCPATGRHRRMARCGSMSSGVTIDARGARSMPVEDVTAAGEDAACSPCPVTTPKPAQQAKGSEVRMVRCPAHGIAYDSEREQCPECAKGGRPEHGIPRRAVSPARDPAIIRVGGRDQSPSGCRLRDTMSQDPSGTSRPLLSAPLESTTATWHAREGSPCATTARHGTGVASSRA
jgi:hypothetical protein